jgi:hypothetical protein
MVRVFIRDANRYGNGVVRLLEEVNPSRQLILFDRDSETGLLNQAWENPEISLFMLNAPTGMGKTVLVEQWLHKFQQHDLADAKAVYFWSFYPPDLTHPLQHPVDEFFNHALHWFGETDTPQHNRLAQGERLARLIQTQPTLFVLDGLELLQSKTGDLQGQLTDPRLNSLLECLAETNPGLCVTISQQPLSGTFASSAKTQVCELQKLPIPAATELLRHLGVQGSDSKLEQIAEDCEQHPFTLTLLGAYLHHWHQGDWHYIEQIPILMDPKPEGRQARRIFTANAAKLAGTASEAPLLLLSLLYQPVDHFTLEELLEMGQKTLLQGWLKKQRNYASLTKSFKHLKHQKRQQIFQQLHDLGLITLSGSHLHLAPWVREFFYREFKYQWPAAWEEANTHLMEYHASLPVTAAPYALPETVQHVTTAKTATPIIAKTEELPQPIVEIETTSLVTATEPAPEPATVAMPCPPRAFTTDDLEKVANAIRHIKGVQKSLQMLQQRTKKFQKSVRQLDKDIQSMHYPPAKAGTGS